MFSCKLCPYNYTEPHEILVHHAKLHNKLECTTCGKNFSYFGNLTKHMKRSTCQRRSYRKKVLSLYLNILKGNKHFIYLIIVPIFFQNVGTITIKNTQTARHVFVVQLCRMSQLSVLKQTRYKIPPKIKNVENESNQKIFLKTDPLISGFTIKDEKEFISDLEKPSVYFFNMAIELNLHTDQEMNQENYEIDNEIDINKLL